MKPLWPFENAALGLVLITTVHITGLPWSYQTIGWALGAFAAHTIRSHMGRMREDSGKPEDWTNTIGSWLVGTAAVLAASAPQRILLIVPLFWWIVHTLYRTIYRHHNPAQSPSWCREDD